MQVRTRRGMAVALLRVMALKKVLNKISGIILVTLLTLVIPFGAWGAKDAEPWRELVPAEMRGLPDGVLKWYITETDYLSRDVDPMKIASPKENSQDPAYLPENKRVFDVMGLWIPEEQLKVYSSTEDSFRKDFVRNRNGKTEVLFLIHPESTDLYKKWIDAGYEKSIFKAAATSSSRSVLIWKPGQENNPFVAKLSLNKTIAQVNRGVKGTEVAKSIGISETLEGAKDLPVSMLYMKESFGAIPLGLERGGMILRDLPKEMRSGESHFVPLFALYGDKKPGFLLWALQHSKKSAPDFITEKIIRPFAQLYTNMALKAGILVEPHAQNALMEIRDGQLTGRFLLRDFGGFTIDFDFRKKQGLFVPENLPTFSGSVTEDYSLKWYTKNIRASLAIFFEGGFLYNIENALKSWQKNKWIPAKSWFDTSAALKNEIEIAMKESTGKVAHFGDYFDGIDKYVYQYRGPKKAKTSRRIGFFSGTFDPPHEGHRDLIERSIRELHLDEIIVVAGIQQDHKPGATSHELREKMMRAAFADIPEVRFVTEAQMKALSEGGIPSLQQKLSSDFAKDTVYQIMGDDSLERLENNPRVSFPDNFIVAVGNRDPNSKNQGLLNGKTPVVTLSPDYRQYSSTKFRKALSEGQTPAEISAPVLKILREAGIYGTRAVLRCQEIFAF